ncbi:MAG: hypothetical protein P8J70_00475 [Glaciecola sp.]|jgi:hypothetical protein|nr:hypothetical protein [Glaciecola sp.]MDG1815944.1 hypothetical protein [Glaciecola sp.]MDG2098139.1 hypothetical protein [Glaciecola sp.]
MSRVETVTQEVKYFHDLLQEEINLPELTDMNEPTLRKLLDRIYRFETRCTVKKQKYSEKLCVQFRGRIADLLLLMDNFDLQDAIANRDNIQDDITSVA